MALLFSLDTRFEVSPLWATYKARGVGGLQVYRGFTQGIPGSNAGGLPFTCQCDAAPGQEKSPRDTICDFPRPTPWPVLGRLNEKLRRLSCESAGKESADTNRRPIPGLPTLRRIDMKASTTLASLAAAASLVGVIGIAYAQSGEGGSQGGGVAQTPQQTQMAPSTGTTTPDSSMSNSTAPGSGSTAAPSTNDTLANTPEPAPQADRN
jgi:hypothetical protein